MNITRPSHSFLLVLTLCSFSLFTVLLHAQTRQIQAGKQYPVTITNLGTTVNSSADDFAPMPHGSGKILFLTSNQSGRQQIYRSVIKSGTLASPVPFPGEINTSDHNGGASITPDGHFMIFTRCSDDEGYGDCDLYSAEYESGQWTNIRNLGSDINSAEWESQPSLSADGRMLFFASNREGGKGGTDLWMCTRTTNGRWSEPVNLSALNTAGNEASPCIAADNATLYFSSDGWPGPGGFDVYMSKLSSDGWSSPLDLGQPINTVADELFYTPQLASDNAYFASSRSDSRGGLDLYKAVPNPLPPGAVTAVIGTVADAKTKAPIGARITVRDIQTEEEISSFHSDDMDGSYVVVLQRGRTYIITAEAEDYLFYSERFEIPANSRNSTIEKNIFMAKDAVRLLVFFDFDKAVLTRESTADLKRAVSFLKANSSIRVEVAGHTDNVGSVDYNKKLSLDRASSVKDFLVKNGIDGSRISVAGYGPDQPIAPNDTEEGRAQNRRVELRVR